MADVKFINVTAPIAGSKDIYLADVFEGLTLSRSHYRPTNPVRLGDGTLIMQSTYANKKDISLSGGVFVSTLPTYFESVFEANETLTVTPYDYVEGVLTAEAVLIMKAIAFEDSKDFVNSTRAWTVQLMEI